MYYVGGGGGAGFRRARVIGATKSISDARNYNEIRP